MPDDRPRQRDKALPALNINTGASALQMANAIFGDGVTVNSATYSGSGYSSGIYSNGNTISPGVVPADSGVILSTGRATDFTRASGAFNQSPSTSTDSAGQNNNALFNAVAGTSTFDASFLTVNFTPTGDSLSLRFVFASEEYPEFAGSLFNDVVVVYVNGTAVDLGFGPASVGSVNGTNNENLFISNTAGTYNTEMDGFTVTLTMKMPVNPGVRNTLVIGIADVGDALYDSNLLIAGDSAQTVFVAQNDAITLNQTGTGIVDVVANDGAFGVFVTHINGVAVVPGDSVVLPTGQTVTLTPAGTLSVTTVNTPGSDVFTYTVQSGAGLTDTAYVTVTTVPCFTAGTMILTPRGEVPIETLAPGDLVVTHDHGPQPVRWIGRRRVLAAGRHAPVRIAAGTLGAHGRLLVSPQHRILVRDPRAEFLFGEPEVLVAAKDMVNGRSISIREGGEVDYVHLLFDRHQVIFAEGLACESFLPGPHVLTQLDQGPQDEVLALFPELADWKGAGADVARASRLSLRSFEACLLFTPVTARAA
jgi:hypothetical protein